MREIVKQLLTIWADLKMPHRILIGCITLTLGIFFTIFLIRASPNRYVPLFPSGLGALEVADICKYLETAHLPFLQDRDKGILVSESQEEKIRSELTRAGYFKQEQNAGKGFELFDTNTWIKGEKELQVLEMRAIKGQLEKDLCGFEQIKNASVLLDIPPARSLGGHQTYKTKASVILTLMPGAFLSNSTLRAITFHLTGAVRGLEPNRIAISDSTGKLHKAMIEDSQEASHLDLYFALEEKIEEKIQKFLEKVLGFETYHVSVQVNNLPNGSEKVATISLFVDATRHPEGYMKELLKEHLEQVASNYGNIPKVTIRWATFPSKEIFLTQNTTRKTFKNWILAFFALPTVFVCSYGFYTWKQNKNNKEEEKLFKYMSSIDLVKLASLLKNEEPETIALMVSYLKPERAEELIQAFPVHLQDAILGHLSEMEKDP